MSGHPVLTGPFRAIEAVLTTDALARRSGPLRMGAQSKGLGRG